TPRSVVYLIHEHRQPVGNHHLLEQAPGHELQAVHHALVVKRMFRVELGEEVLGPLDGAGNQLRIKHHVKRIDDEVPFSFVVAAIDLDGVAHGLKGMKRQAYGKNDRQGRNCVVQPKRLRGSGHIVIEEIEVLEERQDANVGDDAQRQEALSDTALRPLDENPGVVIDDNREPENQDVLGNEGHVKRDAGRQQQVCSEPVWKHEIEKGDDREEDEELK